MLNLDKKYNKTQLISSDHLRNIANNTKLIISNYLVSITNTKLITALYLDNIKKAMQNTLQITVYFQCEYSSLYGIHIII